MALWLALPGFRGDSSERIWLYRVCRRDRSDYGRERRRGGNAPVSLAVVVVLFVFLRWLNLTAGVGALRATRANVESMFSMK